MTSTLVFFRIMSESIIGTRHKQYLRENIIENEIRIDV